MRGPGDCSLAGFDLWPISSQALGHDTVIMHDINYSSAFNPCGPLIAINDSDPDYFCERGSTAVCDNGVNFGNWPPVWSERTAQGELRQAFVGDSGSIATFYANVTYRCGAELARLEYVTTTETDGGDIVEFIFHTNLVCSAALLWFYKNEVVIIACSGTLVILLLGAVAVFKFKRSSAMLRPREIHENAERLLPREERPLIQADA